MEPLKPLKPLGAPQGIKPLAPVKPVGAPAPAVQKPVEAPKSNFNALFAGDVPAAPEAPTTAEVKKVAQEVAKQVVEKVTEKTKAAEKKATSKPKAKETDDGDETPAPKKSSPKYSGPRHVKVYGQLLFTENDPSVSMEAIRERIATEFGFEEYAQSRTQMSLDEATGIVVPQISFQKKG